MAENLHTLVVTEGSKKKHFRKGQGLGSGNGKTAGKGQKGQGAHAHTKKRGFEGGQMPLARRLPNTDSRILPESKSHCERRSSRIF